MELLCDGSLLPGVRWSAVCIILEPVCHRAHYWLGDTLRDGETWCSQGTELIAILIALLVAIDIGVRTEHNDFEIIIDNWEVLDLIKTQHFSNDMKGCIYHWSETVVLRRIAYLIEQYFADTNANCLMFRHKDTTRFASIHTWPPHLCCSDVHLSRETSRVQLGDLNPSSMPALSCTWNTIHWAMDPATHIVVCYKAKGV